jgi:hypothetical protein
MTDTQADTTYDFRDVEVLAYPRDHLLQVSNAPGGVCVTGAKVVGDMSRGLTWGQVKFGPRDASYGLGLDKAGIAFPRVQSGEHIIENSWVENVEDALLFPRSPDHPGDARLTVRSVYGKYIRDDFIEADGCFRVEVRDTLLDEGFIVFAARPGRGRSSPHVASWDISDSLFHMSCKPDERPKAMRSSCAKSTTGQVQSTAGIFKVSACWGPVQMRNVIFRVDASGTNGKNGGANLLFPPGAYQDVTVVWLGPGDYPGRLPPSGVTVTRDVSVWNKARTKWLADHGCDLDGNDCRFLHR